MKWPVPRDELWPPPGWRPIATVLSVALVIAAFVLCWPLLLLVGIPVMCVLALFRIIG